MSQWVNLSVRTCLFIYWIKNIVLGYWNLLANGIKRFLFFLFSRICLIRFRNIIFMLLFIPWNTDILGRMLFYCFMALLLYCNVFRYWAIFDFILWTKIESKKRKPPAKTILFCPCLKLRKSISFTLFCFNTRMMVKTDL